jgi:hypothetical protein
MQNGNEAMLEFCQGALVSTQLVFATLSCTSSDFYVPM